MFSKDWLFKGPKESDPLLIPISNGIPLENWNFPNSPFGTGGRGPNAGCCFVFSFRLPCSEICYIRETKQIPRLFHLSSRLFENVRKRAEQRDEAHFTKLVDNSAIAENYYNQSGSSYVEQEDKREKIDIVELNERIEKIVARENELRTAIDAIIKDLEI